jgi:hypothetical protein
MGNFSINIQGVGCHSNQDNPTDADRMAADFVKSLVEAGHHIESASITHGGKQDLLRGVLPDRTLLKS